MLRGILSVLQLYVAAQQAAEARRDLAWAAAAGVIGFAAALVTMFFAAAAAFLALQTAIAPHWAALAAAASALAAGAVPFAVLAWRRARRRRRAAAPAACAHTRAENAMLIGTLASAFLSGMAAGAGPGAARKS